MIIVARSSLTRRPTAAFTLLETLVALAIVAISLVALLRLHAISVRMNQRMVTQTHAALVAEEKMHELLAGEKPPALGVTGGIENRGVTEFTWQRHVGEPALPQSIEPIGKNLREITVTVEWPSGDANRTFDLTTYTTLRQYDDPL